MVRRDPPEVLRHDNTVGSDVHELKKSGGRALTGRFRAVLEHYGLRSTRIRPGKSHENGVAERANGLVRGSRASPALRGSRDFDDLDQYRVFAGDVIERRFNRGRADELAESASTCGLCRRLPYRSTPPTTPRCGAGALSGVSGRAYSVPSRLIGHQVEGRQYSDFVEVDYHRRDGRDHAALARRERGPHRLSPHHLVAGA